MSKLRAAVIGARGMGATHARNAVATERLGLVATCDINERTATELAGQFERAKAYTDAELMLREVRPDVVIIATPNLSHAPLAQAAIDAGARGVYVEKPMTVHLADARALVQRCREKSVTLLVGHQRRQTPLFRSMRRVIADGGIGELQHILCNNAGDILSDGTHSIDTARFLAGDPQTAWVLGQVYRNPARPARPADPGNPKDKGDPGFSGRRYGHVVESGGLAAIHLANGVRVTIHHGEIFMPGRWYQSYEISGSRGRILRVNDQQQTFWLQDEQAGGYREVQPEAGGDQTGGTMRQVFTDLAALVADASHGGEHPMGSHNALAAQEILSAVYESARTHTRLTPPIEQDRFPLELMYS